MTKKNYLQWLASETPTAWWHDSGDPDELRLGLDRAAVGVTTNPVLTFTAYNSHPKKWAGV